MNKRVLVITYYWPPAGGAGVQRWLKFVKYLREFGWDPVVFTVKDGHFPVEDKTLKKDIPKGVEVIKVKAWEPYAYYKRLMGMKKKDRVQHGFIQENSKKNWKQELAVWIRGNFFIPDARMFWVQPSLKFLMSYLITNPVHAVVTTGPPHSAHLIGLALKEKMNMPWLADFRDPWTEIDFYHQLKLSRWADQKHHRLERQVLQKADKVVAVGWYMAERLAKIAGRKVEVVSNGFDKEDFFSSGTAIPSEKFEILHIGSLNQDRNPSDLWILLQELCKEKSDFANSLTIKLLGKVDYTIVDEIKERGLDSNLVQMEYVVHDEVPDLLRSSQLLLLSLNNVPSIEGIVTGKLFEYLAAQRPILCIGSSTGDASRIIRETGGGRVVDFGDKKTLRETLLGFFNQYTNNDLNVCT